MASTCSYSTAERLHSLKEQLYFPDEQIRCRLCVRTLNLTSLSYVLSALTPHLRIFSDCGVTSYEKQFGSKQEE